MYFRRQKRIGQFQEMLRLESSGPVESQTEAETAEHLLAQHEEFLSLRSKLEKLPVKYQEALTLRYFESKSVKQIAEIPGKREGTVKSLLSRGIARLRDLF